MQAQFVMEAKALIRASANFQRQVFPKTNATAFLMRIGKSRGASVLDSTLPLLIFVIPTLNLCVAVETNKVAAAVMHPKLSPG